MLKHAKERYCWERDRYWAGSRDDERITWSSVAFPSAVPNVHRQTQRRKKKKQFYFCFHFFGAVFAVRYIRKQLKVHRRMLPPSAFVFFLLVAARSGEPNDNKTRALLVNLKRLKDFLDFTSWKCSCLLVEESYREWQFGTITSLWKSQLDDLTNDKYVYRHCSRGGGSFVHTTDKQQHWQLQL